MPAGDGTGPMGAGPMTGRGAGFCAGYGAPGSANPPVQGGGWFRRRGGGYGHRHWFHATGLPRWMRSATPMAGTAAGTVPGPASQTERSALLAQVDVLEQRLQMLKQRTTELGTEEGEK